MKKSGETAPSAAPETLEVAEETIVLDNEAAAELPEPTAAERKMGQLALDTKERRAASLAEVETPPDWQRRPEFVAADRAEFLTENYSPEELIGHPERRFNVNPAKFPIFRDQAAVTSLRETRYGTEMKSETLNINETFGRHITCAADTVAVLAGEVDPDSMEEQTAPADAVIYLDKSARPVRWMMDAFWDTFTEKPRPKREQCMMIDRLTWLRAVGIKVNDDGNMVDDSGEKKEVRPANYDDFKEGLEQHPLSRSILARARLALIPGGVTTLKAHLTPEQQAQFDQIDPLSGQEVRKDDASASAVSELPDWLVDQIFATPTGLEGKTVTIVDEVTNSGATLDIAQHILSLAVADDGTKFQQHVYWPYSAGVVDGKRQMDKTPVWYDHDRNPELGKGVGDLNYAALYNRYNEDRTDANLTDLYAAPFTGRPLDMSGPEGESSVELQREITWMSALYRTGHGFMESPRYYSFDKFEEHCTELGITIAADPKRRDTLVGLKAYFASQRPDR